MESRRDMRSTASKHRLSTMKRAVRELGDRAIDGRTSVAKALSQWRAELINDLGGREAISTQQAAIVDLATKTKLLLDSVDSWLLVQPSLVDKRRRAILPVVRERQQLADALARYMSTLGLERRQAPARSLAEYLEDKYGGPKDQAAVEQESSRQPAQAPCPRKMAQVERAPHPQRCVGATAEEGAGGRQADADELDNPDREGIR